jgi:hypothetical protein
MVERNEEVGLIYLHFFGDVAPGFLAGLSVISRLLASRVKPSENWY